jgi:hypothetical protein
MRRLVLTVLALAAFSAFVAQAASAAPPPGCHTAADVCEPDHVFDVYFYNPAPVCTYEITIEWGDRQQNKFMLTDTYSASHTYADPGVYNYLASSPPGSGPDCPSGEQRYTVEIPFSDGQLGLISRVERAAHRFRRHFKPFKKAAKRRSAKLKRTTRRIVTDGKKAKTLRAQWQCPVSPAARLNRCDGGLPTKSEAQVDIGKAQLQELWGFLKSLTKLANYPQAEREKADRFYQTNEGKFQMDLLSNQQFGKNYGQLNAQQKQDIAAHPDIQRESGAVNVLLDRARAAGKAGLQVEYAH